MASALAAALGPALLGVGSSPRWQRTRLPAPKPATAFVPVLEFVSKNKKLSANLAVVAREKSIATIAGQGYQCRSMKVRYYEGYDALPPP